MCQERVAKLLLPKAIAKATIEAETLSILKQLARCDVEQLTSRVSIETVVGSSGAPTKERRPRSGVEFSPAIPGPGSGFASARQDGNDAAQHAWHQPTL
jgi:hypothetical protein